MTALYNEFDPFAAQWLRHLSANDHIAPCYVDDRSIEDLTPDELRAFDQVHLFAGIGVWSYALRRIGWPDDKPIWTASCPCQPFSSAGKGGGFDDERHLWPHVFHLVTQCRPERIVGEQVASKDGLAWLDLVQADLEAAGYAFAAVDLCAAGVGAPHIRQRLYWYAQRLDDADNAGLEGWGEPGRKRAAEQSFGPRGLDGGMADPYHDRRAADLQRGGGDAVFRNGQLRWPRVGPERSSPTDGPSPTNGYWRNADWLHCRDGKWRPVEPGTFPLAHGAAARVGRLRGYGNAIVAPLAEEFLRAALLDALVI